MGEREIARAMLAHALADVAPVGAARTTAPADAQAEELLPDEPSPTAPRAA